MTTPEELKELIAALGRDAGYYAMSMIGDLPKGELVSWDQRDVRAWQAAQALRTHLASEPEPDLVEALAEIIGKAWDDGNAVGLDGWIGPGRGEEPDSEGIAARERYLRRYGEPQVRTALSVVQPRVVTAEQVEEEAERLFYRNDPADYDFDPYEAWSSFKAGYVAGLRKAGVEVKS